MASYHARQRDPLLDQNTQAMLERRGKELFGILLMGLALALTMMLWTYSPKDPGWMVATDEPAANAFGRLGASISSTLVIIVGRGAWVLPLVLLAWGLRFARHAGADRAPSRAIFAPIAVVFSSIFAAALAPGQDWNHSFGLGGLFGDTVLAAVLGILPFGPDLALRIAPLLLGAGAFAMLLFVCGFDRPEIARTLQFLRDGLVQSYAMLAGHAEGGAQRAAAAARRRYGAQRAEATAAGPADHAARGQMRPGAAAGHSAAMAASAAVSRVRRAPPPVTFDEMDDDQRTQPEWGQAPAQAPRAEPRYGAPLAAQAHYAPPREKAGLFGKVASMVARRSDPQPELIEPTPLDFDEQDMPDADRIRERISSAVRTRTSPRPEELSPIAAAIQRREPSLQRPNGPVPLIADPARRPAAAPSVPGLGLRAEPPVAAAGAAIAAAGMARTAQAGAAAASAAPRDLPGASALSAAMSAATARPAAADLRRIPAEPVLNAFRDDDDAGLGADDDDWEPLPDLMQPNPRNMPAAPAADRRAVVQHAAKRPIAPSSRAKAEEQPRLRFDDPAPSYELPALSLLANPVSIKRNELSDEALEENARMLESVLDDYGVRGEIVSVRPGPVVTMYELEPAPGLKASRVIGLADDIARSMSALSARVSTVPGRTVIGIELPNATREKVLLREILAARDFGDSALRLPLALGKDIGGDPIVANLAKMPHLLIAGTTGSGKSVAINTMILSLLYKLTPEDCRLIMIDPKMLELSVYDGIPHLLSPVVTDPKKAVVALKWVVGEMEERYRKMSKMGVRNIEGYNGRVREALEKGEMFKRTIQTGFDEETGDPVFETEEFAPVSLPYIVVIVDEMADLMMVAGKEIEACIQRLAQMARASGIHLIMATQRPSVDVITGTIKANFPTRISFQVTSKIDSRTILGEQGAEQLLGMGDMLYMAGGGRISRIHGPFVSDEEVEEVVNHLKSFGPPSYMSGVVDGPEDDRAEDIDMVLGLTSEGSDDALYDQAVAIVAKDRKCSTSYIQRKLGIGYNKAARLVEQMEEQGVVTPANHVGKREILIEER